MSHESPSIVTDNFSRNLPACPLTRHTLRPCFIVFQLENGCLIESANRSDGRPFDFFRRRKWRSIIEKNSKNLSQSCSKTTIVFLRNILFFIMFSIIVTPKLKGREKIKRVPEFRAPARWRPNQERQPTKQKHGYQERL